MSIGHLHPLGVFDAGHCRACAARPGCLTTTSASRARKPASAGRGRTRGRRASMRCGRWAPPGVGILLAAVALLTR
jgi:hypothetical protein